MVKVGQTTRQAGSLYKTMDPNRHHEVIGSNDERKSAMYFSRGVEDSRSNTQYYSQERVIVNNKSCMCPSMSNNITCNACPSTANGNWSSERTSRADFQNTSTTLEKVNQNSLYIHDGRQYFPPNSGTTYATEMNVVGLQQDRNSGPIKSCALESNYNFKQQLQHQQPQHQAQPKNLIHMHPQSNAANIVNVQPQQIQHQNHHVNAIGAYPKETIYDDVYASRHELHKEVKVGYHPLLPDHGISKPPIYSDVIQGQKLIPRPPVEMIRNTKLEQRNIINPSNSMALKEQQASPTYARKCPQIFTHGELSNTHPNHQSLYMSTPQFSSEKFNTIHSQMNVVQHSDHKARVCTTESVKVNDIQMPAINNYAHHSGANTYHHHNVHEQAMQQSSLTPQHQELLMNNVSPHISRSQNFYMPGAKTQIATISEMPPSTTKQAEIPSQYSKSQKTLPSHNQIHTLPPPHHAVQSTTHDMVFKSKDSICNEPAIHPNSALYLNPYKTSSPMDSCCKDASSSYGTLSNSFSENSAQLGYHKYNKIAKETVTKNTICAENQNTPPPTPVNRANAYKAQPYYYEAQHIKYDSNVHNTNFNMSMSPTAAAMASPSPSQTTPPTHIQIHHSSLTPQSQSQSPSNYTQIIRQQQHNHNQIEMHRTSARVHQESATIHPTPNLCSYDRHPQNSKPLNSQSVVMQPSPQAQQMEPQTQTKPFSNLPIQGQKQNAIKKSQAPKTNYRELINQVVAMRSAKSEKELDLQIIKKALNSAAASPGTQPVEKISRSGTTLNNNSLPLPVNTSMSKKDYGVSTLGNGFLVENVPTRTQNITTACPNANLSEIQQTIKLEEPLHSSPLDLSMRTVKTKADSTEYRYNQAFLKNLQSDYKHTLPRVDFTPNFALHSDDRPGGSKVIINQPRQHLYNSSEESKPIILSAEGSSFTAHSPAEHHLKQYPTNNLTTRVGTATLHRDLGPVNQEKTSSLILKSTEESVKMCQVRPSVVETNPYATTKLIKSEPNSVASTNIPKSVELHKAASSITSSPLPSNNIEHVCTPHTFTGGVIKTAEQISRVDANPAANKFNERNINYLGRKRHLQEYSNSQRVEPVVKQNRYQETFVQPTAELATMEPTTSVIAINERVIDEVRERDVRTVEKSIQAEIVPCCQRESSIIINTNVPICKSEPLTPTMDTPPPTISQSVPIVPIKTETSLIIAARIRTKAELKGFTFNTPIDGLSNTNEPIKIKEEPSLCQTFNSELPSIPGLDEEYDSSRLLDCNWNSKCSDFMEQLLTNTQKQFAKCRFSNVNIDLSEELKTTSSTNINFKISDRMEQKPLNIDVDTAESSKSCDIVDAIVDSTMTGDRITGKSPEGHSSQSNMVITQKKICKQDREKMRLQQEKRMAARLQVESSSESDDEIHKRKSDRSKKPLKKAKARLNTHTDPNQFSDCGSDSSDSNDGRNSTIKQEEKDLIDITSKSETEFKNKNREATTTNTESKDRCQTLKSRHSESSDTELHDDMQKSTSEEIRGKESHKLNEENQLEEHEATKAVQDHCISKEVVKSKKKPKVHLKIGLNTMTRSKQKREMELQLANGKVLRNDKIIRNSTTKIKSIKRKYVRKFVNNSSSVTAACKEISSKETDREPSMRLRSRNEKTIKGEKSEKVPGSSSKKLNKISAAVGKSDNQNSKPKNKEQGTELLLEVYRYKRSLKIPPSLITIDHPHNLKMAASLPDLDCEHDSSAASAKFAKSIEKLLQKSTPNMSKKSLLNSKTQQEEQLHREKRSIIDVLHSRVTNTNMSSSTKPKCKKSGAKYGASSHVHSDVSHSAESSSVTEMLSIPVKKEPDEESSDGKKRHFSIFETTVLKSKTRTESKMQQRKEIIREIFVGDDRPASAPPEIISQMSDGNDKMTFEQKYEQFLQQLNIVINDSVSGSISAATSIANQPVKDEEDTLASTSVAEADDNKSLDPSTISKSTNEVDNTTSGFRRRRPGKYLRRKGSSGFDYIRKKKKPNSINSTNANSAQNSHSQAKFERKTEEENYEKKVKTEDDVCREINKWVLNKSVGQSAMHKAARLGYIDVVVYCLDRMGMNPDQKDNAGYTPLHEACTKGWLEIARTLLQYGANHSEAAHSGIRPLHEASENDHEELVRLLLSYGADPQLATYAGQTPLMLASSTAMRDLLNNHLSDVKNFGPDKKPWKFNGPWEILDPSIYGYDIFGGAPNFTCDMSRALRKSSISNSIANKKQLNSFVEMGNNCKTKMENCAVVLDNIDRFNSVRLYNDNKPEILVENSDSEGEMFEFEEADILLPPLYLLKDEGTDKWVLLSDLCNLLKVKSKDTLLNKIYPPSSSASSTHKSLMRELKMSDFLERATCLQLLCAGEKINICASKVVLIKYNDSVRNLLGVKTILMKF
ncbi:uncharacterized protein LOC101461130 isoform X1 [Ceratitis capitata]|uniref:uncharacterized protein LOC101461130 isoform X1 n=2 Tax=Ceratitis capitata TaxID=7213 RepID=UPI0006188302|nr:uncharacterized protein LOC101461130 isoform X1 [Ceratitis capitata]